MEIILFTRTTRYANDYMTAEPIDYFPRYYRTNELT